MAAKTASMYVRIEPELKAAAEKIYAGYGLTLSQAITVFLTQTKNVGGLPFNLRPNPQTLAAIEEGNEIIASGAARFDSAADMLRELKASLDA
jgi:DNA-damage-inducible protein J